MVCVASERLSFCLPSAAADDQVDLLPLRESPAGLRPLDQDAVFLGPGRGPVGDRYNAAAGSLDLPRSDDQVDLLPLRESPAGLRPLDQDAVFLGPGRGPVGDRYNAAAGSLDLP